MAAKEPGALQICAASLTTPAPAFPHRMEARMITLGLSPSTRIPPASGVSARLPAIVHDTIVGTLVSTAIAPPESASLSSSAQLRSVPYELRLAAEAWKSTAPWPAELSRNRQRLT